MVKCHFVEGLRGWTDLDGTYILPGWLCRRFLPWCNAYCTEEGPGPGWEETHIHSNLKTTYQNRLETLSHNQLIFSHYFDSCNFLQPFLENYLLSAKTYLSISLSEVLTACTQSCSISQTTCKKPKCEKNTFSSLLGDKSWLARSRSVSKSCEAFLSRG